MRVYDDLN